MTHLGAKIPVSCNLMPDNLHDRLFSAMHDVKSMASKRTGRTKTDIQRNRFSWLGPGDLIDKGSRLIITDCIYIGMK